MDKDDIYLTYHASTHWYLCERRTYEHGYPHSIWPCDNVYSLIEFPAHDDEYFIDLDPDLSLICLN